VEPGETQGGGRKPVQALLCEGVNEVFAKRNMPRIAK
jgi:hypothetical protein